MRDPRARLIAALAAVGVLAGLVWAWWSPARPEAYVVGTHSVWGLFTAATLLPGEQENWAASDGRFAVLMLIIGLAGGAAVWSRRDLRGPWTAFALGLGSVLGSLLAGLVGCLVGGGHVLGKVDAQQPVVIRTVLNVHSHGLFLLQSVAALLVYGVCTAFARDDDLGRPEDGKMVEESIPSG